MIKMSFEGGDKLAATLAQMSKRLSRRVQRDALADAAELIRAHVSESAPRAPGEPDLADNVRVARDVRPKDGSVGVGVGVPRGFFYDWFNEFGTVKQPARPFWRPVLDTQKAPALKMIREALWDGLMSRGFGLSQSEESDAPISGGPGGGLL